MIDYYPVPVFVAVLLVVALSLRFWMFRRSGWGVPGIVVLATVTVWYLFDVFYNDYARYIDEIGEDALSAAGWQVCFFLVSFGVFIRPVTTYICRNITNKKSIVFESFEKRLFDLPEYQRRLEGITIPLAIMFFALMAIGLWRVNFNFIPLFMPYISGYRVEPWSRGRLGGGIDAFLALGGYFQLFLTACFGVLAALLRRPSYRNIAILLCLLAFPYFVFDRTRNTMLASVIPGFLAWALLRVRGSVYFKAALLMIGLLVVNFWMIFVMAARQQQQVASALYNKASISSLAKTKHDGLNMFEELGWINRFISQQTYMPNWGMRYFAEVVNPIPRVLWPDKPLIGIDYAKARGQGMGVDLGAGVFATISTGMIGQGVVNFGRIFGPIFAAGLMAIWVGVLTRQDLLGRSPGRLVLYAIGIVLTFNMGRDISLLVLYPFVFGVLAVRQMERRQDFLRHDIRRQPIVNRNSRR